MQISEGTGFTPSQQRVNFKSQTIKNGVTLREGDGSIPLSKTLGQMAWRFSNPRSIPSKLMAVKRQHKLPLSPNPTLYRYPLFTNGLGNEDTDKFKSWTTFS